VKKSVLAIAALYLTGALFGQTTVDGGRIFLGPVDSSSAASTKPFRTGLRQDLPSTCAQGETYFATDAEPSRKLYLCSTANTWTQTAYTQGTALPSACSMGDMYFKTDAAAGQNLYFCTAANTWTQMAAAGGGGGGNGISAASLPLTYTAGTQTIACPTCEISGNKGSVNGYAALDSGGKVPSTQLPAAMTPSAHAATHAPGGSDPIATDWSAAAHSLPVKTGASAAIPAGCTVGELYFASDAGTSRELYGCTASNTWTQFAYQQGTATPGTCTIGDIYFRTDAAAGQNLYFCTAANTWTQMAAAGGGGGGNGISAASLPLTYTAGTQTIACPTCEISGNKGSANGYAALDSGGRVPSTQLPAAMTPSAHAATHAPGGSDPIATNWSAAAHSLPVKTGANAAIPAGCTVGELYFASDAGTSRELYGCTASNTWTQLAYQQGTATPGTCAIGDVYFKTTATAGQNLYFCTSTNTWTQMAGGSGGGGGYSVIKDHGVSEPQRSAVWARDNLTIVDDGSSNTMIDFDPNDARVVTFSDDFLTGTTTNGSLGLGWEYNQLGATGSILKADTAWPNLGVYRMTGSGAANNGWALHLGNTTSILRPFGNLAGNSPWTSQWIFKFTTATKVRHMVGFAGICSAVAPADVIGLRLDTNSGAPGGADSGNYKFEVRVAGASPILVDSGVPADTNFHTVMIRMMAANRIGFTLDGGTEKLICAAGQTGCDATGTLPSANMDACAIAATDDTTPVELQVDKFSFSARVQTAAPGTNGRN
jgi:hypothetical protein